LLTEGVADAAIIDSIDGKLTKDNRVARYNVNITYKDGENGVVGSRYIQVYALGSTSTGNKAIRAYQINGATKTENAKWKTFLVDNIISWVPTNMAWFEPIPSYDSSIPSYNNNGDGSFSSIITQVKFEGGTKGIK